jgi:hypothetical protein
MVRGPVRPPGQGLGDHDRRRGDLLQGRECKHLIAEEHLGSGGVGVLDDQAAQDGSSADLLSIDVGHHRAGSVTFVGRDALRYALVGSGGVAVVLTFREDGSQVRFAEDQRPVEDLAAQRDQPTWLWLFLGGLCGPRRSARGCSGA